MSDSAMRAMDQRESVPNDAGQRRAGATPKTAMVFAAGLGTRMRPITDTLPKPLVRVAGRALIDHMLDRFADEGVETAVVNVHWLPDLVIEHLRSRTRPRIVISDERDLLLDQGGGIMKAAKALGDEPFLLCNTDAFWVEGPTSNLQRLASMWDATKMDALLLVAPVTSSVGVDWRGDFAMLQDGRLKKRPEHGVAPFVYTGVGIIDPRVFANETRQVFGLSPYFFAAAENDRLYGQRLDGLWLHVGSPEAIGEAEAAIARSAR